MSLTCVKTAYGWVQGEELTKDYEGIACFKAIPYAKPPVGKLRFAPPVPPDPWEGILEVNQWPDIPMQNELTGPAAMELYFEPMGKQSEDCLYINIHTPARTADEKLPVLLWYHDGGLTNGYAYDPRFQAKRMAREGMVVVSVGHRLGTFGYLALPQLKADDGCVGNYGFMDTLLGLKWVRDNVSAFGGDPGNVTLAGESGGTVKCCALAACGQARGMFKRVINQSGLQWKLQIDTEEQAFRRGQDFLMKLGLDPDISAEELRALPVEKLMLPIDPHDLPGKISVDGKYFTGTFEDAMMANIAGVDFLNVVCGGEGTPGYPAEWLNEKGRIDSAEHFYAFYRELLGDLYDTSDFERLVPVTRENLEEESFRIATLGLAPNVRSNVARNVMIARLFSLYTTKTHPGNKAYTARFWQLWPRRTDYDPLNPAFERTMAEHPLPPHGSDMWYSTGALEEIETPYRVWTEADHIASRYFIQYLSNFVKYGTPNGRDASLPAWPEEPMAWMDLSAVPQGHQNGEDPLDPLIEAYVRREFHIR
ncbi:MAG: carboxylesterase family protein [Clostridia bacterium]|nr:carboxylesterase family protein [Clostridia bacterium]